MATIRTRRGPSGARYQVLFREGGRQRSVTYDDATAAQRFVNLVDRMGPTAALAVVDAQAEGSIGETTVLELCRAHVAALDGITAGTRKDYTSMIDRRVDGSPLGELPVSLVTVDHVRAWLAALEADGLATKTRRNHHALLSAAFETGIADQALGRNPARGIRIKRTETSHGRVFLSAGEFAILLGAIDAHFVPFVAFLAGTGMRFGEATALTVGDVDLDAPVPVAHVTKAFKRSGTATPVLGAPKTRAGTRTVPLAPETVASIRHLVDERPTDGYLFSAKGGGRIRNDHFHARVWKPAVAKVNKAGTMRKRPTVHALRHTYASSQIAAGVNFLDLKTHLGHESITTTVDTYGHLAPGSLALGAKAASTFLAQALPELEN